MQKYELPTGYLFVDDYSKGALETLSIGDYGKRHNVKADFLGYTREIDGVENTECMPLSDKWVITMSTQYGCPMKCTFCDVPSIKYAGNASFDDLKGQLISARNLFPHVSYTDRLNIHYARMGEPAFNPAVLEFTAWLATRKEEVQSLLGLRTEVIHPVFTTSMPAAAHSLIDTLSRWCHIKNDLLNGQAGLQLSINSTSDVQRNEMFSGMALSLDEISKIGHMLQPPIGRKYCLNFALASHFEFDAALLDKLFDREKFMVKITPIHNSSACRKNNIETTGGYLNYAPYKQAESDMIALGWDVLVFVPSVDEEDGLVTCGNAVISGTVPATGRVRISGVKEPADG